MKKAKICPDKACTLKKKKYTKDTEVYCTNCGAKFAYVCKYKKCDEILDESYGECYCPEHLKEQQKKAEKRFELIKKLATGAAIAAFCAKVISDGLNLGKKRTPTSIKNKKKKRNA